MALKLDINLMSNCIVVRDVIMMLQDSVKVVFEMWSYHIIIYYMTLF